MAKAQTIWWAIAAFLVGIFIVGIGMPLVWWTIGLSFVLGIFITFKPRYFLLLITLPSLLFGAWYYHYYSSRHPQDALKQNSPPLALVNIRTNLSEFLRWNLGGDESAYLEGLALSSRNDLSKELLKDLKASGTIHLIAASGYKVQLIAIGLFDILLWVLNRRLAFFLAIFALILYVVLAGAGASAARAGIMTFLVLFSREIGRPYSFDFAALWAAFFMVIWDPTIIFTAGFALSFTGFLGIVYLTPALARLIIRNEEAVRHDLLGIVAASFAAGLAILPVTLAYFGSFSLTSFLANIAILPLLPLTMFLGGILVVCGTIPLLGRLMGWFVGVVLDYQLAIIHFFSKFSLPIQTNGVSYLFCAIYYLLLISFIFYANPTLTSFNV